MKYFLVCILLTSAWAADFQKTKLLNLEPFTIVDEPTLSHNPLAPWPAPKESLSGGGTIPASLITVAIDGIKYSAPFTESRHFHPSRLIVGDDIEVKIAGNRMVLRDDRGKDVKADIVRRERTSP
jgi:hypothetical protein